MHNAPLVSIVLPIRNEVNYIKNTLTAVFAQDYPAESLEILIADGESTDGTREIISQISQNLQHTIKVIDNSQKIVPTALNAALSQANGDIIIRVDGHTIVASDYIRQCVSVLQKSEADNVGGKMHAVGENYFGKVVAIATSTPFGVGGGRFHYSDYEEWVDTVYMGAWRRDVFERIGLFDEELVRDQDDEFNYRLRANGGKILLSPKIKSKYTVRGTPAKLWKQYFQYGYWKVRVLQKHPRQMRPRQFIPPLFVLILLVGIVVWIFSSLEWVLLALIGRAYLGANFIMSLWAASQNGWSYLPLLPITYAILHLSYGLGFLVGLFRFAHRWGDKKGIVPELILMNSEMPVKKPRL